MYVLYKFYKMMNISFSILDKIIFTPYKHCLHYYMYKKCIQPREEVFLKYIFLVSTFFLVSGIHSLTPKLINQYNHVTHNLLSPVLNP